MGEKGSQQEGRRLDEIATTYPYMAHIHYSKYNDVNYFQRFRDLLLIDMSSVAEEHTVEGPGSQPKDAAGKERAFMSAILGTAALSGTGDDGIGLRKDTT